MAEVVTFVGYRPPARYDTLPWTDVRIEEAATEDGTYTVLETQPLSPVDADPAHPAARSFTTELGTALDYWYRLTFVDGTGDTSQPTTPVQNTAGGTPSPMYGTVDEAFRRAKIRNPTSDQTAAMTQDLVAASLEVNREIDRTTDLTSDEVALATEVALERAIEHWQQGEVPYGIWENALGPIVVGRDTWDRHALKLAPLKQQWGLA